MFQEAGLRGSQVSQRKDRERTNISHIIKKQIFFKFYVDGAANSQHEKFKTI